MLNDCCTYRLNLYRYNYIHPVVYAGGQVDMILCIFSSYETMTKKKKKNYSIKTIIIINQVLTDCPMYVEVKMTNIF